MGLLFTRNSPNRESSLLPSFYILLYSFYMQFLTSALPYIQIGLSILLIASILLQQTGVGLGEAFGGSGSDVGFHTRRGAEKILFIASIVLGILFLMTALFAVLTNAR